MDAVFCGGGEEAHAGSSAWGMRSTHVVRVVVLSYPFFISSSPASVFRVSSSSSNVGDLDASLRSSSSASESVKKSSSRVERGARCTSSMLMGETSPAWPTAAVGVAADTHGPSFPCMALSEHTSEGTRMGLHGEEERKAVVFSASAGGVEEGTEEEEKEEAAAPPPPPPPLTAPPLGVGSGEAKRGRGENAVVVMSNRECGEESGAPSLAPLKSSSSFP